MASTLMQENWERLLTTVQDTEVSYTTLSLGAATVVALILWLRSGKTKKLPPGPKGLPYFGLLRTFGGHLNAGTHTKYLQGLHAEYGPIITFKAGAQRFVFINDGNLVTELFKQETFAMRPFGTLPILSRIAHGKPTGIIFNNGESNVEMRRMALLSFRDFGVGKQALDDVVQTEATLLTEYLETEAKRNNGIVSGIKPMFQQAAANVIHNIIFGYRNEYDDPKWRAVLAHLLKFFEVNFLGFADNYIPILKYLPPLRNLLNGPMEKKFWEADAFLREYAMSKVEDHRSSYTDGEIRDFVDLFIKYEREHRDFYTSNNIFGAIMDLFRAGTDTTATSLTWSVMYLAKYPAMQEKIRQEVDEIIGDQVFDRKDKDKLVKTNAFINEMMRYVSVAPFTPPHTVAEDTVVQGYTIPANSLVLGTLYSIHHDESYWGDPDVFRIERWIGEDGKLIAHDGYFMPFSKGKRACPGKQIARIELILFLVELIQNFTLGTPEGYSDMSDDQNTGLVRSPNDFHIELKRRT